MPGIYGIISARPPHVSERELATMERSMTHEPFYRTGTMTDKDLDLYMGWVCQPGASGELSPKLSEDGTKSLVFYGETFSSFSDATGYPSAENSLDSLLKSYETRPDTFPADLNGWFQGLIADRLRGSVVLFNDRHGFQRIYVHEGKEAFYFASEAKAILSVNRNLRNIDDKGLGEFISCGCVLNNRTLFPQIQLMPGSSLWSFNKRSTPDRKQYFSAASWEKPEPLPESEFRKQLNEELPGIIKRYLEPAGHVALSLTGGLDTRIILAHGKPRPRSIPCYTFGGVGRDSYDVKIARDIARTCGQEFKVLSLDARFLESFADLAERTVYLTDGTMDMGGVPELYLNQKARGQAPVRLTGNYGSEVLRRLVTFGPSQPRPGIFNPDVHSLTQRAETTYHESSKGDPLSFILFKQVPWHHYSRFAVEQSQLTPRSPFLDADLLKLLYRAPLDIGQNEALSLSLIDAGERALGAIPTDRGTGGNIFWRRTRILKAWRHFLFKAEYAFDYGMPDQLARVDRLLTPLKPERAFLGLHKFYHFRSWFRHELSSFVKGVLLDPAALRRPYLVSGSVEKLVNEHVKGQANHTLKINQLLSLEYLHRLFVDGP